MDYTKPKPVNLTVNFTNAPETCKCILSKKQQSMLLSKIKKATTDVFSLQNGKLKSSVWSVWDNSRLENNEWPLKWKPEWLRCLCKKSV